MILRLVVLQDAPQHVRKAMMTRRVLREEAQHVVEDHSVDDSMDAEVACGKDVEMDVAEDTYKEVDRRLHWDHRKGVDPETEDREEGSRYHLAEDTDDGVRMLEVVRGGLL